MNVMQKNLVRWYSASWSCGRRPVQHGSRRRLTREFCVSSASSSSAKLNRLERGDLLGFDWDLHVAGGPDRTLVIVVSRWPRRWDILPLRLQRRGDGCSCPVLPLLIGAEKRKAMKKRSLQRGVGIVRMENELKLE